MDLSNLPSGLSVTAQIIPLKPAKGSPAFRTDWEVKLNNKCAQAIGEMSCLKREAQLPLNRLFCFVLFFLVFLLQTPLFMTPLRTFKLFAFLSVT